MTLKELRAQRAAKLAELKALATKEEKGETLADNERARFDTLETEIRSCDDQLGRAERAAEIERRAPANPIGERRDGALPDLANYSLARVVRSLPGERLDGLEGEVEQELAQGREVRGHMVPIEVLGLGGERRAQTVSSGPAGGYTVGTDIGPLADRFRAALRVEAMGATVLRGLTGFLDLPNLASSGSATWVVEGGSATRTGVTFEKSTMSPKTVTAEYELSRRMILQSSIAIEDLLRRDLGYILAQALDSAAIKRRGVSEAEPEGILDHDIEKVTTETLLSDTTANLIAALELDDVMGTGAFLTSPKVRKGVMKVKEATTNRVIPQAEIFHNVPAQFTSQIPDNIGGSSDKSALIYGLWSELVIGYWSGVDILANPYHSDVASKGGMLLHAFLDADVAVRHEEAFAYAEI